MLRRATAMLAGIAIGFAFIEASLWVFAFVAPRILDRSSASGSAGEFRILCIGDSHTFGWAVERDEAYPAQLERLLNEGSGTPRYQVVNLGVPASNSSQVVTRLPRYIERYDPQLLLVTIGGNDPVNFAENDAAAAVEGTGLRGLLGRLRIWRLIVYALQQRELVRSGSGEAEVEVTWKSSWRSVELREGEMVERFEHRMEVDARLDEGQHAQLLGRNLEALVRIAQAAGIPLILASYTHDLSTHEVSNRVMQETDGALFVSQRLPALGPHLRPLSPEEAEQGYFFRDLHPRPLVYAAGAANLRDVLLREGLVPVQN